MIEFTKVSFRNFLSYGSRDIEFGLNEHSSVLLTGNSGSGKSTIVAEALTFGLYGKPFRKIRKNEVCNTVNGKDCLISIDFRIGDEEYRVVRGVKPDKFEIYLNGLLVNQNPNVRDYQKHLEDNILQMSYKVWTQIVILGFANHTPFMDMSASERRAMVDEVLGIEAFQKMLQLAKDKVATTKDEIQSIEREIEANNRTKDLQKQHLENLRNQERQEADSIRESIKLLEDEVSSLESVVNKTNEQIKELREKTSIREELRKRAKTMNELFVQIGTSKSVIDKQIDFISNNTSCPTCKQDIGEEYREAYVGSESGKSSKMAQAIADLTEKIREHDLVVRDMERMFEQLYSLETDAQVAMSKISTLQRNITEKHSKLSSLMKDDSAAIKDLASTIIALVEQNRELTVKTDQLKDHLRSLVLVQSLLKEDGIKGKIISYYMPVLTSLVNDYLEKMNFTMKITFDDNFSETIYARYRDKLSIGQLSQGEQSRINLALVLAWRALAEMRSSVKCNILVCDELLDVAISAADVDSVMDLVKSVAQNQHLFIISHKPQLLSNYVDHVVKVEKKGNFSQIVEGA